MTNPHQRTDPPRFPFGEYADPGDYDRPVLEELLTSLESFPEMLAAEVESIGDLWLDQKYRNWTIRQIVHHVADSHVNCYVRFKWALTEDIPTIKSYNESLWSELVDARTVPVASSLVILKGIHMRWGQLMRGMTDADFDKQFFHPESQSHVSLKAALPSYVWHGQHHLAQIKWVKANRS